MKLKLLTAAMLAMAIAPMQANAAVATATMQVTAAVVAPTASVLVAGPLAFGTLITNFNGGGMNATTTFDVTVTNRVPYRIDFGGGLNSAGTAFFAMKDAGSANTLSYSLYKDSTTSLNYPANSATPSIPRQTGTGVAQAYTLYAQVVSTGAAPGNFSDTITITVTY
ncbi:MAG: spore coat protein U domain-containing protein [Zetaproteobacteria bacterium]|nr:spore coat protein U domain-containing protein [Zetaproteobacteria bacterium]